MICNANVKRWGSSLGVVIPMDVVRTINLNEGEEICFEIKRKENVLREMFGIAKDKKINTEEILREIRGDVESKWLG